METDGGGTHEILHLFTKSALQFMLDHVDEQGYSIGGDVIGKLMLTENRDGKKRSFLEVNIPVS
ncbi:hypothetical protein HMSSN036_44630 [Paenibacillus macerans]|nr:hypothetical protein HMSSN036_44630 [Paenibacillus macerans]